MKRAQMIGQVFIFILAGLVFILIITYGYQAINYFIERQEQVVMVDYRTDLEVAIEGVKRDYGTVRKVELKLPKEYLGVCFFDPVNCAKSPPTLEHPTQTIRVPWAQQACDVRSGTIFTVPRALDLDIQDIQVGQQGYLCVPNIDGRISIRLEGTGRKAKVSAWQ